MGGLNKCCVPNCDSKSKKRFRFPHPVVDMHRRYDRWIQIIKNEEIRNLDPTVVYAKKRVCGNHFSSHNYILGTEKLKKNALPDLNLLTEEVADQADDESSDTQWKSPYGWNVTPLSPVCSENDVCSRAESSEMKYCRLCAMLCKDTVSIFGQEGATLELANKIKMILPIVVSKTSKLPLVACMDCISQLDTAVKFVNKCVHAQLKIERIFKSLVEINLDHQPLIYDKSNFEVEGPKSISCHISNQLLSREVISKDVSPSSENKKINDITTKENNLSYSREASSAQNEDNGADQVVRELEDNSAKLEQDLNINRDGFSLEDIVRLAVADTKKKQSHDSSWKQGNKKWFWCKYCNKYYRRRANLYQHQTSAHPALVFQCSHCSKIFYETKENFIKHENSHKFPPIKKKINKKQHIELPNQQDASHQNRFNYSRKVSSNPDSNISHIPDRKQQWIKDILSSKLPINCGFHRSEIEVNISNAKNEENGGKLEDVSSKKAFPDKTSRDSIGDNSAEVVLNEKTQKERRNSEENLKVVGQSEQISPQGDIHPTKKYSCNKCKVQYNTQQEFRHHHRLYHVLRYPCRFCPRTLTLRRELDRHESYHIVGKRHRCRRCPQSYGTINELNHHRMTMHMGTPRYRCETCNKPYFQEHVYLKHVRLHSVASRYLCEMCGKAFKSSSSLSSHRKMYCMNPLEKKLSCEYCGLMFHLKSHLEMHVRMHTGEKPYLCSICGKGYRDSYLLKHHLDTHSVFKHACSFCGQLFLRNRSLVSHLKRHASCNVCSKRFGKEIKQHLLHRREFHSAKMEEELENGFGGVKLVEFADGGGKIGDFSKTVVKCEICTRNFASAFWLRPHQEGLCIDQPIFKCPICEKVTRRKDSYKSHMMSHSKNKIHQCSHCSQTFDIYQNLVKHEKEHKVAKPFSCSECGKGFGSSASLSKHLIAHSTGRVYSCESRDEDVTSQVSFLIHKWQHNTESEPVSPNSMSQFSKSRLAQMPKISHLEEQKQLTGNTCILGEDYVLNMSKESYVAGASLENVAGEVLIYDSQSIALHSSEIV